MKNPIAGIGTKSIAGSGALALSSTPLSTPTLGTLTPGAGYIDVAFSGVDSHATAMTVAYRANSTGAWTEVTGISKTSPYRLSGLAGSTLYEVKIKAHGTGSYTDSAYTTTTTTTTYVPPLTGTFYFHAGGVLNQTAPTGSEAILADGPFGGEFGGDLTLYVDPWTGIDLEGVSSLMDAADDTYHLLSDTLTIPAGCTGFDLWVNEVDFITFALGSGTIAEHTATVNVWYFASSESNSVAFITSPTHPSYVSVAA